MRFASIICLTLSIFGMLPEQHTTFANGSDPAGGDVSAAADSFAAAVQ